MARVDHRIVGEDGQRIPFTCENEHFRTDISKGEPHGAKAAQGSVFKQPLVGDLGGETLWLEHVYSPRYDDESYWLMWYDRQGNPLIPESAVFPKSSLPEAARRVVACM
jgi:hypothetical protein